MRIGIIGGGGAGLASAWLLEQDHDVTLYEADERLGGHAHTVEIEAHGEQFGVDAGFQFFGPGPAYATFNRLLDALEVPRESYGATITLYRSQRRQHVVLPPFRRGWPVWVSLTPSAICDMIRFRRFLEGVPDFLAQHDTGVTIAEYVERQGLPESFTRRFLMPLLLAFWCVEPDDFAQFAAYSALFYVGAAAQKGLRPPDQIEIKGGMKTYIDHLVRSLGRADVRVGAAVSRIEREADGFLVQDVTGGRRTFDQVVVATGARQAGDLLSRVDGAGQLTRQLARFRYFGTTIAVHGDRRLMPRCRSAWSVVNARWDGAHSQLSIWNPVRGLPVFRSWVSYEERMPEPLYATATYEHLMMTVDHFDAQRELKALRGHGGIWLAGLYADDADSHESAVRSAVEIARRLAPGSRRLRLIDG
jgi:predicted NAD/FAD-binding protein